MYSGYQKPRPVDQFHNNDKPDEPATPDSNPYRIQNDVRVGQGAWRNPLLYGFDAGLQHAKAPDPESPTRMSFDITDRIPPHMAVRSRGIYHRQPTSIA